MNSRFTFPGGYGNPNRSFFSTSKNTFLMAAEQSAKPLQIPIKLQEPCCASGELQLSRGACACLLTMPRG